MLKFFFSIFGFGKTKNINPSISKIVSTPKIKKIKKYNTDVYNRFDPTRNAVTNGNYLFQNDKTSLDNFVKDIHLYFGDQIINTSIGGMSTVPPKIKNNSHDHVLLNQNNKTNQIWPTK